MQIFLLTFFKSCNRKREDAALAGFPLELQKIRIWYLVNKSSNEASISFWLIFELHRHVFFQEKRTFSSTEMNHQTIFANVLRTILVPMKNVIVTNMVLLKIVESSGLKVCQLSQWIMDLLRQEREWNSKHKLAI